MAEQCQLFPNDSYTTGFGVIYDKLSCGHYINRAHKERHGEGFCYQCSPSKDSSIIKESEDTK